MPATQDTAKRYIDQARTALIGDWGCYEEDDNDARLREAGGMAYLANAMIAYVNGNYESAANKAAKAITVLEGN